MRLQRFSEEIRWLFEARPALNMLCQNKSHAIEGGSRLQEGRTEVTPSMAARGYWEIRDNRLLGSIIEHAA